MTTENNQRESEIPFPPKGSIERKNQSTETAPSLEELIQESFSELKVCSQKRKKTKNILGNLKNPQKKSL